MYCEEGTDKVESHVSRRKISDSTDPSETFLEFKKDVGDDAIGNAIFYPPQTIKGKNSFNTHSLKRRLLF